MKVFRLAFALAGIVAASAGFTASLEPGMKTPELTIRAWIKGEEIKSVEKGVFVVEFWATWCGPCRATIPHLTELSKKYEDVTFIGVDSFERAPTTDEDVKKFVAEMGDSMDYNIGLDDGSKMADNWFRAAGQRGIPSAMIVKDGILQWVGHPMQMEEPLKQVRAGTFDLAAFTTQFRDAQAAQAFELEMSAKLNELVKLGETDRTAAIDGLRAFDAKGNVALLRTRDLSLLGLMASDESQLLSTAREMAKVEGSRRNVSQYAVTTMARNPKLALQLIQTLVTRTEEKDYLILFHMSEVYGANELWNDALKSVEAAYAIVMRTPETYTDAFKANLKTKVDAYRAKINGA